MKKDTDRHKVNPFLSATGITIGSKSITVSTLGADNNVLVNQHTGEVTGTHIVARKRVDKTKFVKTFANYMAFTFDLTAAGNKALRVVMWVVSQERHGKDLFVLDQYTLRDFLESHSITTPFSLPTFRRGLGELVNCQIIAKAEKRANYYINPDVMFNGDRLAITTILEPEPEGDAHLERDLPLE